MDFHYLFMAVVAGYDGFANRLIDVADLESSGGIRECRVVLICQNTGRTNDHSATTA